MRCKLGHQLIALVALLTPSALLAQSPDSPTQHSLYVALGGDPALSDRYESSPLVVSAGVERARVGSRWSLRLGADYRRQSTSNSDTRWEDFGVGLSARYGRPSGIIRPYLLGGFGIADLRTRGRWTKYDSVNGVIYGQADSAFTSSSRWNGSMTSGLGSDVTLGRLRLFTEARLNLYPARLSGAPRSSGVRVTKALYVGVKF
jgi:hypothetical protein